MDECFADIFQLYDEGKIKPAPSEVFPLEGFAQALDSISSRKIKGRAILVPDHG
jgi:D-arabinose 1-dehydrogenase-like Zn-dependent alcohol dehydrogenase